MKRLIYIFALVIALALHACSDEDFELNTSFIKSNTYAEQSDNTPLTLTTFRLDSVQTSGQNRIWVGKTYKEILGNIHSVSYVRLDEPTKKAVSTGASDTDGYRWLTNNKEVYDSCTLVLRHTGAYEGDTTVNFHIKVSCLSQLLEFADENDNAFYNVRSFPKDSVIGEFIFKPRPVTRPRVRFRLNDTFGEHFRDFIISQSAYSSDIVSQNFEGFMKGIAIESDDSRYDTKALLAFEADSCKLVLHSHIRGMEAIKVERTLSLASTSKQFNQVWNDSIEAPFDQLTERYIQVAEDSTDYRSVMYEGLGYYTRINFPSIENLKNLTQYQHIVKATLKLYPVEGSYDKRRIPSTFYLSEVNKGNVIQNPIYTSSGTQVSATLVYNAYDRSQMYYYADITYYMNTLMTSYVLYINSGLVMTWDTDMYPTNYDFMIFNGHGVQLHRSELEITFYDYDVETR